MAKKDKKAKENKKARAALKNEKAGKKAEQKNKKKAVKFGDNDLEDDVDIDELLSNLAKEQEQFEAINIEIVKRPSKRLNGTLVGAINNGKKELVLFGGETSDSQTVHFYNDLFVYSVDNDIWRRYTSKNSPLPRSSHAMCYHPSGIFIMNGGEFSSPKQSTFHHFSDTWILDIQSKEWSKVDTKKGPSSRSGHRMTYWKNYVILHGGFRDLGTSTTYLNDVWLFDITTYKWIQVEFPPNLPVPDARSGHSLIPTEEGAIVWGGYCKVKAGKGLQKGKMLSDGWSLKMKSDPKGIRWERRRKQGFQPSPRVGCSMQPHKGRGILFGGVYDYEETEESLESEFYNTILSYNSETNRWYSLALRGKRAQKSQVIKKDRNRDQDLEELLNSILAKANLNDNDESEEAEKVIEEEVEEQQEKKEYVIATQLPHPRYNALTTVLDDKLYIFGGAWERGDQEFNLDSMYSVDLAKLDGVKVFWEDLSELERADSDSDEDDYSDDEDGSDDSEDEEVGDDDEVAEEEEEEEVEEVEPEIPDERPWLPHPKAFESLRDFYLRTGADFLQWAISSNREARGKHLKGKSFDLCESRWWERRDQVRIEEDGLEEAGVTDVIRKDTTVKTTKRR
ncbi:unnamed protein product [Kuraishia capsulata CBS 1993]|uniref:DUF4110 domain-containing protein n=1 Tax=Kuraishia capsulata CBS 1993 TaxID=1382522 RepID=W6MTF6_9ASCO|nr:uncharacterized protein KUCA_T00005716001 [Kuraishia capsulata CBS 1993]CDK29723.1 unnamed protein product [Kuraishia capsulata CBS 1993]